MRIGDFMFVLFLPGSLRRSSDYPWLSGYLASVSDFYAIDYPVFQTVARLNADHYQSDCLVTVRRELIYGSKAVASPKLSIDTEHSITASFLAQVRQRCNVTASDDAIWSRTLVIGHSQGAGHAALLALEKQLLGVLLIAGPADAFDKQPSGWTAAKSATEGNRIKMFVHAEDRHARLCLHHSVMLGLNSIVVLTESTQHEAILSSQVVIDTRPLPPLKSHDSLTMASTSADAYNELFLFKLLQQANSLCPPL